MPDEPAMRTPTTRPLARTPVFCTTQWTRVLAARGRSEPARQALSELCAAYYEPVVAFLTRDGREPSAAREFAHDFFAQLLRGDPFSHLQRDGRFRSYLLGALKHFLAHRRVAEARLKRGGGREIVPLEVETDTSPGLSVADPHAVAPDMAFDRAWATTVLSRALKVLRAEAEAEGKAEQFERLKPWLTGEVQHGDQAELARALGLEVTALKSVVHRLKRRFRQLVKAEIASTLKEPTGVEDEMQTLFAALSS